MSAPEILLPIVFTIITIASILILYWLLPQGNMIKCASQICSSYIKDCNKHQVCGKECVEKVNLCTAPVIPIQRMDGWNLVKKSLHYLAENKNSYKGGPGISAAT